MLPLILRYPLQPVRCIFVAYTHHTHDHNHHDMVNTPGGYM